MVQQRGRRELKRNNSLRPFSRLIRNHDLRRRDPGCKLDHWLLDWNRHQQFDSGVRSIANDAIGGTVAGSIDRIDQAVDSIFSSSSSAQRGESEYYSDGLYDYTVSSSDDPYGDWDDSYDMGYGVDNGCY